MTTEAHDTLDPETQFLLEMRLKSKRHESDSGEFGWDDFKENIRPLKKGRNVKLLNHALKSHFQIPLKHSLLLTRKKLIEAIDDYNGDDPLQPWLECIKWVQEAFPAAGDSSGLLLIYEQCARTFWHNDRYKEDRRYLKVWLEYAENCADAEVIYKFLEVNQIGQSYSGYYISYALHLETKNKIKTADEVFNRGLSLNAQPLGKLEAAYRKFLGRSMARSQITTSEDPTEDSQPVRSFGTVLSRAENRAQQAKQLDNGKKTTKGNSGERIPLSVYKDANIENATAGQINSSKVEKSWGSLPTHRDRNKENTAIPAKWTSFKVPPRPGIRPAAPAAPAIEVFIDEECSELHQTPGNETQNTANSQLKEHDLRRETELLKENPLRNFPMSSFPR